METWTRLGTRCRAGLVAWLQFDVEVISIAAPAIRRFLHELSRSHKEAADEEPQKICNREATGLGPLGSMCWNRVSFDLVPDNDKERSDGDRHGADAQRPRTLSRLEYRALRRKCDALQSRQLTNWRASSAEASRRHLAMVLG